MKTDKISFKPFQDASASSMIDQLTLENQGDRVSMYGSLQITCDQQGLDYAQQLVEVLQQSIQYLKSQNLAQKEAPSAATEINNPFL